MTVAETDGLSSREAERRLLEFGPNNVSEPEISLLRKIGRHFWEPVPWMLEAAIVLQIAIGERIEASVIATLLIFNVLLSFFQEGRAHTALEALKSKLAITAVVQRDGVWRKLSAVGLVPGDIIKLEMGSVVPADARVIEDSILVDQSMLTGESVPTEIGGGDLAYAGAMAQRGAAVAEVVATGSHTFFGKTAELVSVARSQSSEQAAVLGVVRNLAVFNGVVIILLIAYAQHLAMPTGHIVALVLTAVLASIPVALPATFTLAAALGAQALTNKGVLLTRLSALNEAAAVDVLCADKTGTLTRNELKVAAVKTLRGDYSEADILALATLASSTAGFDPVDAAIRSVAPSANSTHRHLRLERFTPFDPSTKIAEAFVYDAEGQERRVIKGAPAAVGRVTPFDAKASEEIQTLSRSGSRVLAVAFGPPQQEVLVGMIALSDPPRQESKALIAELASMGVSTVMITGDAEATAASVARAIGIDGPVCSAEQIPDDVGPEDFGVYAGVFPQDKFRLVKAFQRKGHIVGMFGDGSNDAPALRQAQMGVAVSTATDVAKSAASVVLTEAGLRGVVTAIEEGRIAFQRILTYTLNALVKKFQLVPFLAAGLLITGHAIMTPMQMALLLITGDFLTMSIATDRSTPSSTPDTWNLRAITGAAAALGLFGLAFLIGVLVVGKRVYALNVDELRTLTFVALVFSSQATVYVVRDREHMWRSWPSTWLAGSSILNLAIAIVVARVGLLMTSLPAQLIAGTFFATLAFSLMLDAVKAKIFQFCGLVRLTDVTATAVAPSKVSAATLGRATWPFKAVVALGSLVALLAIGLVARRSWLTPVVGTPHYLTATVERGSIVRNLVVNGVVEARPPTPIMAHINGTIISVSCENKMLVDAGRVCVKLDVHPYQIRIERGNAKLAALERRQARHKKTLAFQQARLVHGGEKTRRRYASQIEWRLAELKHDAEDVEKLRIALASAKLEFAQTDVRAPFDGTITMRSARIGQKVVANDANAPLFLLAEDARDVVIAFDIPRDDLDGLKINTPVALTTNSAPGKPLIGVIAQIMGNSSTAKKHGDVLVRAINRDGELSVGARITGQIEAARRDNVLRAPLAALQFSPSLEESAAQKADTGTHLWALRNGELAQVAFKRGLDDGKYVEIVGDAFKEGDQIIVGEKPRCRND